MALIQQGKTAEAIEHYRRALELKPNYVEARNNLGNALRQEGQIDEAEASLRQALQLKPDYAEAFNNLAIVLVKQGRYDEAITNYRQALLLKPDYPEAHKNLGLALLAQGHFDEGWKEYEWRWQGKELPVRPFSQPRWTGSSLEGKTILLHAEQGLGDTMQFIRYAALVEQRGGRVIAECQKPLVTLLAHSPGIYRVIPHGDPLPEFDFQIPLVSLPGLFGTNGETIPTTVPYLTADSTRIQHWSGELKGITGFKIGIVWQGNPSFKEDRARSIPLVTFEPLAKVKGVRLFSLQVGAGRDQLGTLGSQFSITDLGCKLDEKSIMDVAALMVNLDLIITCDTAIAHLAGALGLPVWVAVPSAADWRWLLNREDSPWYPSLRLFRQRKRGDWADVFRRMAWELEVNPALESAETYSKRGLFYLEKGQFADSVTAFKQALVLEPKNADHHQRLGIALEKDGKRNEAAAAFEEALRIKPSFPDAMHSLGNLLRRMGRLAEAEEIYRKALQLVPNWADVTNHLGIALLRQAKHQEAESCLRRVLSKNPNLAEAYNNLGVVLEQLGRMDEAIATYQQSIKLKPQNADTHKNLALALLARGDFARGWAEYEWRFKFPGMPVRNFHKPRWDGSSLEGKAILLHSEQSFGDILQFIRYAPLVQDRGGYVLVEAPASMEKLLARCPGINRLVMPGAPVPDFAFHVPLLSLPGIFQTTLETIPNRVPYLSPDPNLIDKWEKEIQSLCDVKIGIAWQGSPNYPGDAHRSIALKELEPLTKIPEIRLVSLQKGPGTEQLRDVAKPWNIVTFGDRLDASGSFIDTAAILTHLDLVVTSDCAIAHLAGALGKPVFLALSLASDWRWLRGRDDSPWYPTMRLFRQKHWGDWRQVFERIADEIQDTFQPFGNRISPELPLSDLLDKLTNLQNQRRNEQNKLALRQINLDLGALLATKSRLLKPSSEVDELQAKLKAVNEDLAEIEKSLKSFETKQAFGAAYIESSRAFFSKSEKKAEIKARLDRRVGRPK